MSNISFRTISEEILQFRRSFKSVILGTLSQEGEACLSYAPFLEHEGELYIFVSEVAEHFHNILKHPSLELFFIEDEDKAKILSARTRLKYKAKAQLSDHLETREQVLDAFQEKVDATIKMTRAMGDFHLVHLSLESGRFVKGFGQAFDISASGEVSHISAPAINHRAHK